MNLAEAAQANWNKLNEKSDVAQMLEQVSNWGTIAVVGGAVRDWFFDKTPRDIDLVVDCPASVLETLSKYKAIKNRFGGYKVSLNKIDFDIWGLDSTWAFKNNPAFSQKLETIPETVFLNLDAVIYYPSTKSVLDKGFSQAMESKELDTVYQPNPYPYLCVSKSLVALKKYNLKTSARLKDYIREQESRGYSQKSFNVYQKLQYGDTIFDYNECMSRVT